MEQLRRIFEERKHLALCVDIETTRFNGDIAVLGAYRPKEGVVHVTQLIKDESLTEESVRRLFAGCKLIITFNGTTHDIPKIKKQFPGAISEEAIHLDLYKIAKALNLKTGLKNLEQHFQISRDEPFVYWRRKAIKLWKAYQRTKHPKALRALLEYNANDCMNLYPLAISLLDRRDTIRIRIFEAIDHSIF